MTVNVGKIAPVEELVKQLRARYGARLRQVVLYGSYARGEPTTESDIDTLVVLDRVDDFWAEFERISPIANRLSLAFDVVISALPVGKEAFDHEQTPLLINTRREGVAVG